MRIAVLVVLVGVAGLAACQNHFRRFQNRGHPGRFPQQRRFPQFQQQRRFPQFQQQRRFPQFPPQRSFPQFPQRGSFRRLPHQDVSNRLPHQDVSNRFPQQGGSSPVDDRDGGSDYHFSWLHDGNQNYTGPGARSYCGRLQPPGAWTPVAISSQNELRFIHGVVGGRSRPYIWTDGERAFGDNFVWRNGESFVVEAWSHTGGARRPQPDNREEGGENCLAILNDFYSDGIKWHDVGCHHRKPVICEKH